MRRCDASYDVCRPGAAGSDRCLEGLRREVVSLQSTPQGDFVVVFLEGTDPSGVVARYLASDVPFDRWFTDTVLKGVHGITGAPGLVL
jgi:hypothetical protein